MASALQLVVELNVDANPISGRICTDNGVAYPFHGWLELASAIEAHRNAALTVRHGIRPDQSTRGPGPP